MEKKMLQFFRKVSDTLEHCFYVEVVEDLTDSEANILCWLLSETFDPHGFHYFSFFAEDDVMEFGPRLNYATPWNTNALSILHTCGITKVTRIERARRIMMPHWVFSKHAANAKGWAEDTKSWADAQYDRMTEMPYDYALRTFETGIIPEAVYTIPLIEEGPEALRKINQEMGLGMDDWDIDYYANMFIRDIKKNPTNVECFDLGQSMSEHSRHWFFKGKLVIDGVEVKDSLMEIVRAPLNHLEYGGANTTSIIAFNDNSSAIRGYVVKTLLPAEPGKTSAFRIAQVEYHPIFTAETHNFPSGVAPYPGAETGTGGRIRDIHNTGRGAHMIAGTTGYCVGNLLIPGYELPWEKKDEKYPENLASPLKIEIEASNGASDYGNKIGEAVINGFTRSFGMRMSNGERREWHKPIMFTAGVGQIEDGHVKKEDPDPGMSVVMIGGPAYRIGLGGGAASSMIQGANKVELDFNAVQRGDGEMEQKVGRVIRACIEMLADNPIASAHDQGAGGPGNVIKEIIYPAGGKIYIYKINVGDKTLSSLEKWGGEYQEREGLLIYPNRLEMFIAICEREKVPYEILGEITGDGFIKVYDEVVDPISKEVSYPLIVDLELSKILGDVPRKVFRDERRKPELVPLELPEGLTVRDALERILRLLAVGSKRFLASKVDRSVTGLVVRQPCVGPLQLTVSDLGVVAQSHFPNSDGIFTGIATAIGEQPIKGLLDPKAMARLAVAEALTNIVWAKISKLEDVRCSANWMLAAKLPGEGAWLYDAAIAMSEFMIELEIAVDGGKDSLSMAAKVDGETIKAPGQLVISAYALVPDITKVITPDIKRPGESWLIFIDLAKGKRRLGGSALAQCYGQIGNECPDMEDPELLKNAFNAIQELIASDLILSGHDVSDGGLIVALLEMAFAGNCGFTVNIISRKVEEIAGLFAEEVGVVIEVLTENLESVSEILNKQNLKDCWYELGQACLEKEIRIHLGNGESCLFEDMLELRQLWEDTSYQLERLQCNPQCAEEERKNIYDRPGMLYHVSFTPEPTPEKWMNATDKPKVAIIREEGSNGDREMTSAFYMAGFEPWDVTMTDLLSGVVTLDMFRGIAFVGGFSYADVLDSAKGWAGVIRFNPQLWDQFERFYHRKDTFSLGVCNGCQLMALLGWVPWRGISGGLQPRFIHNVSGRFESRFSTVKILPSPALMLQDMDGSELGVWVAHGEGRLYFPSEPELDSVIRNDWAPIRYVDDNGAVTCDYPYNPNGSPMGIAALCSPDGRHLAMMPHPERAFLNWQWGYLPQGWDPKRVSPWLKMFQNARK